MDCDQSCFVQCDAFGLESLWKARVSLNLKFYFSLIYRVLHTLNSMYTLTVSQLLT